MVTGFDAPDQYDLPGGVSLFILPLELLAKPANKIKFDYGPIDKALEEFSPVASLFLTELPA